MTLDIAYIARSFTAVENRDPKADELLRRAYAETHVIPVIGLTGPAGAGKSTLLDHLAVYWAESGEHVAVIAVDPSSPYTGGAVLGDRVRMDRASGHSRVFVRSLSSRGHLGGLSRVVHDMVTVCGVLGFSRVIVETVGSGQSDIEVADLADCVVVVSVPGLGDHVQAAKAGILEIGDVYAVNKADLPDAETVVGNLLTNVGLSYPGDGGVNSSSVSPRGALKSSSAQHERHGQPGVEPTYWRPPVLRVVARQGDGVPELAAACDAFLVWQHETVRDTNRRAGRVRRHLLRLAIAELSRTAGDRAQAAALDDGARALSSGRCTPDEAAMECLRALCAATLGADAGIRRD